MPLQVRIFLIALLLSLVCTVLYLEKDALPDLKPSILQNPSKTPPTGPRPLKLEEDPSIDNLLRTKAKCYQDFPDLYDAIETSVSHYQEHPLSYSDLEDGFKKNDQTWVVIRNNQLFVRSRHHGFQSRVQAVLADLHRAIVTSPERLPDVEILFDTKDSVPSDIYTPVFGLSRGLEERGFLIPDFGYWAWPEPFVNGFTSIQNAVSSLEAKTSWSKKIPQLFWRGAVQNVPERHELVALSTQHNDTWGNVRNIDWRNLKDGDRLDMADHCQFQYLAHLEGIRYSARLKYLQLCNSVIVTHERKWTTHLSHLLETNGVKQNIVVVGDDFENIDMVMKDLLGNPSKSKKIARNSRELFGEKYGRLDAEVCYWRELIRGYHSVMTEDFRRNVSRGWEKDLKDYESVMLMGGTDWTIA